MMVGGWRIGDVIDNKAWWLPSYYVVGWLVALSFKLVNSKLLYTPSVP